MTPLSRNAVLSITHGIEPPDELWRARARAHLDTLTKPLGSLGHLEDLAAQFAAIRRANPALPLSKAVYVFAADHGITAEGVSAYPSAVTQQMVRNFLAGGAAVNVLARLHGVALHVVDMGVDGDFENAMGLLDRKVRKGTRNMLREPAMTDEEFAQALQAGAELADEAAAAGHTVLAVGEMGIGNTTAASAITCAAGQLFLLVTTLPPARDQSDAAGTGQGARIAKLTTRGALMFGSLCTVAICVLALRIHALAAIGATVLVTLATGIYYQRKLAGVTGDCFGATNQLAEIAVYLSGAWVV